LKLGFRFPDLGGSVVLQPRGNRPDFTALGGVRRGGLRLNTLVNIPLELRLHRAMLCDAARLVFRDLICSWF